MRSVAKLQLSLAIAASVGTGAVCAYEVDTHALLTSTAYDRSTLIQSELQQRLGIDRFVDTAPFQVPLTITNYPTPRSAYFDIQAGSWLSVTTGPGNYNNYRRQPSNYERFQAVPSSAEGPYRAGVDAQASRDNQARLRGWLMRGTIREDDLQLSDYDQNQEPPPDPDPFGELKRVYHHFYDPVNDRPLTVTGFNCPEAYGGVPGGGCIKSTDWAFGAIDAASVSPTPNLSRRNHFTYADAHEALMCALTYKGPGSAQRTTAASAEFVSRPPSTRWDMCCTCCKTRRNPSMSATIGTTPIPGVHSVR